MSSLEQCGLSIGTDCSEAKRSFFQAPTCCLPGNPNAGKTEYSGNPDVKGTPREATPVVAIMPIIFQSPADVDILCSGMIQFMATGKYEESERAKSGRHWNVHSFALKSGRHHFVRVAQT